MKRTLRNGALVLGTFALVASSCRKEQAQQASPAAAPASGSAAAPATSNVQACAFLSAAEVGAIFGKTVVSKASGEGCQYGLDPAEKEKEMKAMTGGSSGADGANLGALANSMAKGGGFKMPSAVSDQFTSDLTLSHDSQTEAEIKAIYSGVGKTVRGALEPEKHGLNGTIEVGKDIAGVGDWAFATSVASVNMGMGASVRGRILQARQGGWRLTVGATISPDPGEEKLDSELADMARTAFARLKGQGG